MKNKLKKQIQAFADKFDCPINWERECGIAWNKKDIAAKNMDPENIIHDIAHFIVATKKQRNYNDFGLGSSPDSESYFNPIVINPFLKEREASSIGLYYQHLIGYKFNKTYAFHSWKIQELKKEWEKKKYKRIFERIDKI